VSSHGRVLQVRVGRERGLLERLEAADAE
jgi:hypothetical protein